MVNKNGYNKIAFSRKNVLILNCSTLHTFTTRFHAVSNEDANMTVSSVNFFPSYQVKAIYFDYIVVNMAFKPSLSHTNAIQICITCNVKDFINLRSERHDI